MKSSNQESSGNRIVLVIPVFEDWDSATLLCGLIDEAFQDYRGRLITVLFVDDGSFHSENRFCPNSKWNAIDQIHILRLRRNIGHQRAIAIGLSYVEAKMPCDFVVILDGDGEDRPGDIPALLERAASTPDHIVFAERGRRPENKLFQVFYLCYRSVHRVITGRGIRFGNFSVVPFSFVKRLITMSELWSHYAAAVNNARIPYVTVRVDKGTRLRGKSKMNLESLILHGLSAVAVYQTVSVRVLMGSFVLSALIFLAAAGIAFPPLISGRALSGDAAIILGICVLLICLIGFNSVLYVFTVLAFRHLLGVLPVRDYVYFVERCERVHPEVPLRTFNQEAGV